MTDRSEDDPHEHGAPLAPYADRGAIDAGVTPQQAAGRHPAEGIGNQHDLEGDIVPIDAQDKLSDHTFSPTEHGEGGTT
jgi:hypothetical protein